MTILVFDFGCVATVSGYARNTMIAAACMAGLYIIGCDQRRNVAGPVYDLTVSISHAGHVECSSEASSEGSQDASAARPRPNVGTVVCGPAGSASMTQWKWIRNADGGDEYVFTRAEVKSEGDAGASLEQAESGPIWLGPKQSKTVQFRGAEVVVFDTGNETVVMRSPKSAKPER
jgi:hypothetical protein